MNITFKQLLLTYACIAVLLGVFCSKIYITSQIYYTSREISALKNHLALLEVENTQLHAALQNARLEVAAGAAGADSNLKPAVPAQPKPATKPAAASAPNSNLKQNSAQKTTTQTAQKPAHSAPKSTQK